MRLDELWKRQEGPTLSFEVFPARTPRGAAKLERALDRLCDARPDFFAVTSGAGGSTREGSLALTRALLSDRGQQVLAYFNGYGQAPEEVAATVDAYAALGVESMLLVRGDAPRDLDNFEPHPDAFAHASDLLAFAAVTAVALSIAVALLQRERLRP